MRRIPNLRLADASSTVWVFGAGASCGPVYKVPSQRDLLQYFATMKRPGGPAIQAELQSLKEKVQRHCQRVLPGLPYTDPSVSLEEVFAAFEIASSDPHSPLEERSEADAAIRDLRDALRLATFVYGRGDARKWRPFDRDKQPSPYAELIEKTLGPGGSAGNIFMTFNYDINLDRCLINLRGKPLDRDLDYGIPLANSRTGGSAPAFSIPDPNKSVLLLRTHGALNWLRCHACGSVFTTVNRHAEVSPFTICWACGRNRLDYVLVHPSFLRRYDDPIIRLVWGRCLEELERAERWVFIGYSLPPADVHFRELLRDCLRHRTSAGKNTEIVLVGRGPTSNPDFLQAQEAYRVLFDDHLSVWEATPGGFADFVAQLA